MTNFWRGKYAKEFSEQIKILEKRYTNGENYQLLQRELDNLTSMFVDKCYKYRIGDIISVKDDCDLF